MSDAQTLCSGSAPKNFETQTCVSFVSEIDSENHVQNNESRH
jgi:hypothetical protein